MTDRAECVMTTRMTLAERIIVVDFEEVVKLVQSENYIKFFIELWDMSGKSLYGVPILWQTFWLIGRWSLWKSTTSIQTYLDRESNGSVNECKTATRVCLDSNWAYTHAESETRSANSKMDVDIRVEGYRKRYSLSTDPDSSDRSCDNV